MANLALQMRLGIRRGWRVRALTGLGLYTSSLTHCMFLATLLRVKAFRLKIWVVGYYIICSFRKINIYAFIWRLPGINRSTLMVTKETWVIRATLRRGLWATSATTPVRYSVIPLIHSWTRVQRWNFILKAKLTKDHNQFIKIWDLGSKLLRFFILRSNQGQINKYTTLNGDNY